jgi:hypothetical protein
MKRQLSKKNRRNSLKNPKKGVKAHDEKGHASATKPCWSKEFDWRLPGHHANFESGKTASMRTAMMRAMAEIILPLRLTAS